ncbi:MAG: NADPH-dependent 7-cyano-7-deazaguanine reductase QueF [Pseudomonadales bacterium]|nr:NADPH-dependent 7-cyano-7-deazaguanine reductase QueF [Pseudomonadales bacterium]
MKDKDVFAGGLPLGKETDYQFNYNASLLFPIARVQGRDQISLQSPLPFNGVDRWTAFELSWLTENGMPRVAIAQFDFSCDSENIIESKSFKLYLNSFNQTVFSCKKALIACMQRDLSAVCVGEVNIKLFAVDDYPVDEPDNYFCLDSLDVECSVYQPAADLLCTSGIKGVWRLKSHLLRSLCPVTGQPDWASVYIHYSGREIDRASLLAYIISYRNHQGFHEQCVEQIFNDLLLNCKPDELTVYARFMRRGGLDINPLRTTRSAIDNSLLNARTARQ